MCRFLQETDDFIRVPSGGVYVCGIVCDLETSVMKPHRSDFGGCATENIVCGRKIVI